MQTVVNCGPFDDGAAIGGGDLVNICLGPGEKLPPAEESRLCKFSVAGIETRQNTRVYLSGLASFLSHPCHACSILRRISSRC